MNWKIIGIIFMCLFIVENLLLIYSIYVFAQEEETTKICYYEVCGDYPDAIYVDGVCSCYDYDMLGGLMIVESKVLG